MESKEKPSPSVALRFPHWQDEYQAVLQETDRKALFKRVEIAEAALLTRRDALTLGSDDRVELQTIESVLIELRALKKDVLNFS